MTVRERVQQRRFPSAASAGVVSLMVAADHLAQLFGAVCARHGLTGDQYNVLRILRGVHPRGHPRGEVARRCIHRSPDVTRMLDRLVGQGLAVRRRDPEDRRCSVATITEAGLALLARLDPEIEAATATATARLSRTELRQLSRLCDALVP
ncbi:MAG: MarR family transcriptional regulator [Gemmatimonadetes bacterium]|nr:MarR family transcriptional regulator [Gemmatimonadota bacterium]